MIFEIVAALFITVTLVFLAFGGVMIQNMLWARGFEKYQYKNRELFAFTHWYMNEFSGNMSRKQHDFVLATIGETGKTFDEAYAEMVAAEYQNFLNDKVKAAHARQTKAQKFREVLNNLEKMNMPIPSIKDSH